ncbi:hypothetical protein BROUX41_003958 [Berkeleyomyces rouxiae]
MLGRASTLAKAAAQAAWLANQAIAWGAQNGPSFSQGKTELQHFHRSSGREPTVVIDGTTIQPNKETRWLGIHLDTKLSFHAHVKHMTAKATRAAAHARSLANIIRGVPANLLRLAACAAIFPVLLYGVSVWFHGPQKFLAKGRVGPARQQQLVDMVTKAVAGTARAIIPAYCTTPHAALFREAGILPARVMLDRCRRQAAVRIASLDELHPLARLARARTSTRLTLRHRELPRAPPATRILPLAYPPPKPPEPKDARRIRAAKSRIARIPYCDLQVFSDGLAALASWARSQHLKNVTAYWHGNIPGTYLELQIPCLSDLCIATMRDSLLPIIIAIGAGVGISMYTLQPAFAEQEQRRLSKEASKQVEEVEKKLKSAKKD